MLALIVPRGQSEHATASGMLEYLPASPTWRNEKRVATVPPLLIFPFLSLRRKLCSLFYHVDIALINLTPNSSY